MNTALKCINNYYTETHIYHGSCLCGAVKFTIKNNIKDIVCCHCSLCRKAQGSAFATNGNVPLKDFTFLSGEINLTPYKSSETQIKLFCKSCGSPIMSKNTLTPDTIRVRLGTIESDIKETPEAHVFVDSKANWEQISDTLPRYKEYITE